HPVDGREEDVEVHLPRAELRHRLVHGVERGDRDLAVVLLAEVLQALRIDIGDPVIELQRGALLRLQAGLDRLVVLEDRPGHRVVGPGRREGGAGGAGSAPAASAGGEQRAETAREQPGARALPEEAPPGQSRSRGPVLRPAFSRMHGRLPLLERPFPGSAADGWILTERSVNTSYSYLVHRCRRKTF